MAFLELSEQNLLESDMGPCRAAWQYSIIYQVSCLGFIGFRLDSGEVCSNLLNFREASDPWSTNPWSVYTGSGSFSRMMTKKTLEDSNRRLTPTRSD